MLFLLLAAWPAAAVETIDVQVVFKNKALVTLDGRKVMLKVGDPPVDGVRLVHTDTQKETIAVEINGKEKTLRLGMVRAALAGGGKQKALLFADGGGHYRAEGAINGTPVQFLVDTGATRIALSGSTARSIGLDYQRLGRVGRAATAAGPRRGVALRGPRRAARAGVRSPRGRLPAPVTDVAPPGALPAPRGRVT